MNVQTYDLLPKIPPFFVAARTRLDAIGYMDACTIWTIVPTKSSTPVQMIADILDAPDDTSVNILERLLRSRGHIMTKAQAEVFCDCKEILFFFTGTADGRVSMEGLAFEENILHSDSDPRQQVVDRILVRNLKASWPYV